MRQKIQPFIAILEMVCGLDEKERNRYLRTADTKFIKFLSELCFQVIHNTLALERDLLLKPSRKAIEALAKKNISMKERRRILTKKNSFSNIFPLLIKRLIEILHNE